MRCLRAYELSWDDWVMLDLGLGFEVVCIINDGGTPVLLAKTYDDSPPFPHLFWIGESGFRRVRECLGSVPRIIEGAGMGKAIITYFVYREVL